MRVLIDVDGVVADLMGGWANFFYDRTGEYLVPEKSLRYHIAESEFHADLHRRFDLDRQLVDFLSEPDVYQRYVHPIEGAVPAIDALVDAGRYQLGFVTATLKKAPSSYESKMRWLEDYWPGVPMLAVGAHEKHWVSGDYAIDDRYDTIIRWQDAGVRSLLFRQPWNEAPHGTPTYNWKEILRELLR